MPLKVKGPVRYRYKKGTNIRLAFVGKGRVVEAKNVATGATHTPAEFQADRRRSLKRRLTKKV